MTRQPVPDDDVVHRLVPSFQWDFESQRPSSAAFSNSENELSVWVESRLPTPPDEALHIEKFERCGRLALSARVIRSLVKMDGKPANLDLGFDPEGTREPFLHLRDAHAVVEGTRAKGGARAMARYVEGHSDAIRRVPVRE